MTTSNVSGLPANIPRYDPTTANQPKAAGMGTSAAETQDYFMKMLLAQIQNQDPMNAQDPAQMTSQLTQLNTASGIERLNTSISAMLAQANTQQFMANSALIGSDVLAAGDSLALGVDGQADFALKLDGAASQSMVKVVAADGSVVDELSLGALGQGVHRFSWDGAGYDGSRAPTGRYRLLLSTVDAAGAPVVSSTLTQGRVNGVARTDTGSQLLTTDGRAIDPADLFQLTKS